MQKVAVNLLDWVEEVDLIVTSPYVRARQTAEILSQIFFDTKVVEAPELVPQSPPQAFLNWLKAHGRNLKRVMVVGHEPHLSHLMSFLLAGVSSSFVDLRKSGVACLTGEASDRLAPGSCQLHYLIQPRMLIG